MKVIQDNFLFGVGPKDAYVIIDGTHKGTYHNAYIQTFVTAGFFGILPICVMILLSIETLFYKIFYLSSIYNRTW